MNTATHVQSSRHRAPGQEGLAMFYALLVTLVVGGIVTVVVIASMGETRQSAFELDFEDSLHVAEAGLEVVLQELDASSQYATIGADGAPVLGPTTTQDSFDWAVAAAVDTTTSGDYNLPAVNFGEGEAVAIRPVGREADFAYGVGFHPTRQAYVDGFDRAYVRVLRINVGFTDTEVAGDFALLAGKKLVSNSSSYGVLGLNGSVHTNGQLNLQHDKVAGTISFSDPSPSGCQGSVCPPQDGVLGPVGEESLPSSTIDDLWDRPAAKQIVADPDSTWYDYCDGTGRHTGVAGPGWYLREIGDAAPCTGTWLNSLGTGSEPDGWSGLDLDDVDDPKAVYWIDSTNDVSVRKASGHLSVISLGDIRFATSANAAGMRAQYPGLLMYSEGDVNVAGNATSVDPDGAIIYAGGDLTVSGTTDSVGIAYVAEGTATINGGARLSYDGNAVADIGGDGDPLVLGWEELHAP